MARHLQGAASNTSRKSAIAKEKMLRIEAIETFYGASQVLFGINFEVGAGEVVTLLGRNGMGKTTTVRTIMGLINPRKGRVFFDQAELTGRPAFQAARAGLGLVPEGRQIFPNLTLEENLVATARPASSYDQGWTLDRVLGLFPVLGERRRHYGNQLSGGEQQMLAIGRALMTNPRLLILDEATEGLAPLVRREIWQVLRSLKQAGLSILLIDKNLDALLRLADRHVIIEKGRIVWQGTSAALAANEDVQQRYLALERVGDS